MRSKPFVLVASISALLALLALSPGASAQLTQQFWDGSVTTPDGVIHGGSGTWNTANTNWTNSSGTVNNAYSNFSDVIFSGSAGVVTLGSNITSNGNSVHFSTDGYVINPNGFVLEMFRALTVDPGVTATINAPLRDNAITGLAGLTKGGAGTLILSGMNTYTGFTALDGGVLSISQDANLGTPGKGSQLIFNGGTLQATATFTLDRLRRIALNPDGGTFDITGANVLTYSGLITGEGHLTKVDTGTLTLVGINTYTGITAINAGVLSISQDANLGALRAPVADQLSFNGGTLQATATFTLDPIRGVTLNAGSGTFDVTVANVLTFGGVITGPGNLTKADTGTLTLTGPNSYIGRTNLNGGTLAVNSDANLGTGALSFNGGTLEALAAGGGVVSSKAITLNSGGGTFLADTGSASTLSGAMTGVGTWTKIGPGTLTLSGVNTYTGATTVSAGVLQAGSVGAFSPGSAFTVNTGAVLDLNGFNNAVGSLSGSGLVSNSGGVGALSNATLSVGANNTSTTFSGTLQDGVRTLALTKVGIGTLTLTGANTHSGGTNFNGGTLAVNSDANLGIGPLSFNGGTLEALAAGGGIASGKAITLNSGGGTFSADAGTASTLSGAITSVGAWTKTGPGTLTLTGMNTYTGATTVNAGSLIVDGAITSAQTLVNAGGLLGGHGSVGSVGGNLVNSGIVSPGGSPGTLTVNSNYTQNTGGTLRIELGGLSPSQHDLLTVNGHASLAGTLQLIGLSGFTLHVGDQVTFLTANAGVSGSFATVQNQLTTGSLVKAQVIDLPNSVVLEGTQGSFVQFACNPNSAAVAQALNSAAGNPRTSTLIAFLDDQPLNNLCGDFTLIAPEALASIFNAGVSLANVQTANLIRRLEDIHAGSTGFSSSGFALNGSPPSSSGGFAGVSGPEGKNGPSVMTPTPENRWGVWVTGIGEFTNVDSTNDAAGYDIQSGGVTLGVDYRFSSCFAIGLTAGYAHINGDLPNGGNLDVNAGQLGLYGTVFGSGFYADAAVTGGPSGYDSRRTALLGSANGNTDGGNFNVLVAAGYDWQKGGLSIGPTANFQYSYVGFSSFTENGSLAPLNYPSQNAESERTAFGMKASYDWKVGHVVIRPEISLAWQHEFGDQSYSIVSSFANGAGNSFTVNSPPVGRDSMLIGAGAAVLLSDRISLYAYYDGELLRTNYESNSVSAGVRMTF